jgi:hypothetical protein
MYYIYHIEDIKIGCTTQPIKRTKEQGFLEYNILETHSDIYVASDREIELQKQYGLPVDTIPYWQSSEQLRKGATFASASKGGKIGGKKTGQIHLDSGHWKRVCSLGGKAGGKAGGKISGRLAVESGHVKIMAQKAKEKLSIPCIAIRLSDNTHIEYSSQSEASRELLIATSNINSILRNGKQKSAKGYTFKYKMI